jgi:hypothetical protein
VKRSQCEEHTWECLPVTMFASLPVVPRLSGKPVIHVSDAGRGGAFSRFSPGRSEISSSSPALSRSPDHHAFLPVALGLSGKPVIHVSHVGRAGRIRGLPSHTLKISSSSSAPSPPLLLNRMFASSGKSVIHVNHVGRVGGIKVCLLTLSTRSL